MGIFLIPNSLGGVTVVVILEVCTGYSGKNFMYTKARVGMGFKSLKASNLAKLEKQAWKLITNLSNLITTQI